MPASWAWLAACAEQDDSDVVELGIAAVERVEEALYARDQLNIKNQLDADGDASRQVAVYLNSALTALSGAFDAVARVAHDAYKLNGKRRYASWRKEDWRKQLAQENAELAQMMERGESRADLLELIAIPRNTVHGQALRGAVSYPNRAQPDPDGTIRIDPDPRRPAIRVVIPKEEAADLQEVALGNGGEQVWGLQVSLGTVGMRTSLDAAVFLNRLLPAAAGALNDLMEMITPDMVEDVSGLPDGPDEAEEGADLFGPPMIQNTRLLAGL